MPDERESPSAGWREVCDEMETDPRIEEATHSCPDCGQQCENVLRDVYDCEEHGVFRVGESDDGSDQSDSVGADDSKQNDETEDRTAESPGTA